MVESTSVWSASRPSHRGINLFVLCRAYVLFLRSVSSVVGERREVQVGMDLFYATNQFIPNCVFDEVLNRGEVSRINESLDVDPFPIF